MYLIFFIILGTDLISWMMKAMAIDDQGTIKILSI